MLETITDLLGGIAVYITALLGLVALYFLWVAFREWQAGRRAAFGIERDMARSEMVGALARASVVVVVGLFVYALGQLGQDAASESVDQLVVNDQYPAGGDTVAHPPPSAPTCVEVCAIDPIGTMPPRIVEEAYRAEQVRRRFALLGSLAIAHEGRC